MRLLEVLVEPKSNLIVRTFIVMLFYNECCHCTLSSAEPDGAIFQQTNALSSETLLMTFIQ